MDATATAPAPALAPGFAPGFAIRRAIAADVAAISQLIASLAHHCTAYPDGRGAERFFAGITAEAVLGFVESPRYHYLVGERDGQLAGVSALRDNSHLFHLFVDTRFQGCGLASRLWAELHTHALEAGNPGQFTVNASVGALPVYRRFGFAALGGPVEQDGLRYVRMCYPGVAGGGVAGYIALGENT